jgi:hypothetical protein
MPDAGHTKHHALDSTTLQRITKLNAWQAYCTLSEFA